MLQGMWKAGNSCPRITNNRSQPSSRGISAGHETGKGIPAYLHSCKAGPGVVLAGGLKIRRQACPPGFARVSLFSHPCQQSSSLLQSGQRQEERTGTDAPQCGRTGSLMVPKGAPVDSKNVSDIRRAAGSYSGSLPIKRYAPMGTRISNRAPFPGVPVSRIVIPVSARISRERNRPRPVFFPYPWLKIFSFSFTAMPIPLSSHTMTSPSGYSLADIRIVVACFSMTGCVIQEVGKDPGNEGIGKNHELWQFFFQGQFRGNLPAGNYRHDLQPQRFHAAEVLVDFGKLDVHADGTGD